MITNLDIDSILNRENQEIIEAHKEIVALQKGTGHIIKTGQDHLDYFLVGGLNNKMVFVGSRPSMGKTHHCETTIDNLLDEKINPNQNISILRLNLEMQTKSLLLRDLKKTLGKKMIDIISSPYTDAERELVKAVVKKHQDKRIINFSSMVEGNELRYLLKKFSSNAQEKDDEANIPLKAAWQLTQPEGSKEVYSPLVTQRIVLLDHLHIYQTKKQIDDVLSILNEMKMADKNMSFIIYFQFNRSVEDLWRDTKDKKANPKNFLPNSSHIYNTDSLMQYADVVVGLTVPQVVDMEEFASVYKDRSDHLSEHFIEGSSIDNATIRLKGRNRIYYNYIKIRLVDDFEDSRLYCSVLNPAYEESASRMYLQSKPAFTTTIPVFGGKEVIHIEKLPPVAPNFDVKGAFDIPEEGEEDPKAPF
jgi:replicative DNA helicase